MAGDDFTFEAFPTIDAVTFYALQRNGLDSFTALRAASLELMTSIPNIGPGRFRSVIELMETKGYGDTQWVTDYKSGGKTVKAMGRRIVGQGKVP